jgi:Protein of unknown function (DUF4236)
MGYFRFRRSIKLLPGVRWNIGKKSTSLSFGVRGAQYTVGTSGSRTTVGIPGTGLSYTETSGRAAPKGGASGSVGCLGQIIVFLIVVGGISMCVNSGKETPATDKKTTASPTPLPSATPATQPTPAPTATPPPFPESRYWPKEVRISAPVVLSGTVGGGTIMQTAKPGDILNASLSPDHKTVTLRRLDITGKLPIGETDFVERAKRAAGE